MGPARGGRSWLIRSYARTHLRDRQGSEPGQQDRADQGQGAWHYGRQGGVELARQDHRRISAGTASPPSSARAGRTSDPQPGSGRASATGSSQLYRATPTATSTRARAGGRAGDLQRRRWRGNPGDHLGGRRRHSARPRAGNSYYRSGVGFFTHRECPRRAGHT